MLTLDTALRIPAHVSFTFVEEQAVLLNLRTNQYFSLDEVGAHLWALLKEGTSLREGYPGLLEESEVEPAQLEQDVLELMENLKEHGLVEIVQT